MILSFFLLGAIGNKRWDTHLVFIEHKKLMPVVWLNEMVKKISHIQFVLELNTPSYSCTKNHSYFVLELSTFLSFGMRTTLRYPWSYRESQLGNEEITGKNSRLWFEGMYQIRPLKRNYKALLKANKNHKKLFLL